jgi:hypothetical protein
MFNVTKITIRRLVLISIVMTLISLFLMVASIIFPGPLLLVVAMSMGQALGIASLVLYLLAIALDLQGYGEHDELGNAGSAGSGTGAE